MVEQLMILTSIHIFSPPFGLMANVASQLLGFRYITKLSLLHSILIGFLCGSVVLLSIEIIYIFATKLPLMDSLGQVAVSVITYCALGYCYFHFVNLGETARRVRIVRELYGFEAGLSMEEILGRYNARDIVDMRISRLVNNGQVVQQNGRYYIGKPTVLLIAKFIVVMKLIILGKKSEFN